MAAQRQQALARGRVPHPQRAVVPGREQPAAVRRPGDTERKQVGRKYPWFGCTARWRQAWLCAAAAIAGIVGSAMCVGQTAATRQRATQPVSAQTDGRTEVGRRGIALAKHRCGELSTRPLRADQPAPKEFCLCKPGVDKHRRFQIDAMPACTAKCGARQIDTREVEHSTGAFGAEYTIGKIGPRQLKTHGRGRGQAMRCGVERVFERQLAHQRSVGIADAGEGRQCGVMLFVFFQPLAEKMKGFTTDGRQIQRVFVTLHHGTTQEPGEKELQQRGVRKPEAVLTFAHQEGGGAQVFLQQLPVDFAVVRGNARIGFEEIDQPLLDFADPPHAFSGTPQLGGKILHQRLFVVGRQLMFAHIPFEPGQHHVTVEHEPGNLAPLGLPAFDLMKVLGDEAQGIGPLGNLRQIVHRTDDIHDARGVLLGQGLGQIAENLVLFERQ